MLSCPDLNANAGSFYSDLAIEFKNSGHNITIVTPALPNQLTGLGKEGGMSVLRVESMNSDGVSSVLKKGIALTLMPYMFKRAFKKYLGKQSYDLILMPTPPITLIDFASYVKKKTKAKLYLILRDIHPHSSRSIGMCNNEVMYKFLYSKAQKAYKESDYIGCMSPANIDFVLSIAPNIEKNKVVLLPNWVKKEEYISPDSSIREKYGLRDKFFAIFGGTIGVGQAIWNIITLAEKYKNNPTIVFVVVGKGIRKQKLVDEAKIKGLDNIRFVDYLPREDYNDLLKSADIGIISLDERYKVPTSPSKIIGYMSMKIPVIAMINKGSDYGYYYIDKAGCGLWSEGLDKEKMFQDFDKLYQDKEMRIRMGNLGYKYFMDNLTSAHACERILNQINNKSN